MRASISFHLSHCFPAIFKFIGTHRWTLATCVTGALFSTPFNTQLNRTHRDELSDTVNHVKMICKLFPHPSPRSFKWNNCSISTISSPLKLTLFTLPVTTSDNLFIVSSLFYSPPPFKCILLPLMLFLLTSWWIRSQEKERERNVFIALLQ